MQFVNPDAEAVRRAGALVDAAMSSTSVPRSKVDVPRVLSIAVRGLVEGADAHGPESRDDLRISTAMALTQGWGEREGAGVIAARMDASIKVQTHAAALLSSADRHADGEPAYRFSWLIPEADPEIPLSDAQCARIDTILTGVSSSPERQASLLAQSEGRFADLPEAERDDVMGRIGSAETTRRGMRIVEDFEMFHGPGSHAFEKSADVDPNVKYDELLRRSARMAIAMASWPRNDIAERIGLHDPDKDHPIYEDAKLPYRRDQLEQTIMNALVMEKVWRDGDLSKVRNDRGFTSETIKAEWGLMDEARRSFAQGVPSDLQAPSTRSEEPALLPAAASYSSNDIRKRVITAVHDLGLLSEEHVGGDQEAPERLLLSEIQVALNVAARANTFTFLQDRKSPEYAQAMAVGAQMRRGDFSRMEADLKRTRELASWMAPMLSASTRDLLGVGRPVEQSVVHGIMVNARRGIEIDTIKDRALDATRGQAMAAMAAAARSR